MLGWQQAGRVMRTAAIAAQVREASRRFGLHLDPAALVATLPLGRRQRVEILKAILRDAELLILDEPTSNLAPTEIADLLTILRRLRAEGKGIIFITHKLPEVLEICDEVVVLRDGRVSGRAPVAGASRARLAEMMVGRDLTRAHKPVPRTPGGVRLSVSDLCRAGIWLFDVGRAGWEILGVAGVDGNGQIELTDTLARFERGRYRGRHSRRARYHACAGRRAGAGGPRLHSSRSRLDRAGARDVRCRKSDAARQRQLPLCSRSVPHPRSGRDQGAKADGGVRHTRRRPIGRRDAAFRRQPAEDCSRAGTRPRTGRAGGASGRLGPRSRRHPLRADQVIALRDAGAAVVYVSSELEEVLEISDRIAVMAVASSGEMPTPRRTSSRSVSGWPGGRNDGASLIVADHGVQGTSLPGCSCARD